MPLSYRNIINGDKIKDIFGSNINDKQAIQAKYVKGYDSESFLENIIGENTLFGLEKKELDPYDPYTESDAKKETFWGDYIDDKDKTASGRALFEILDKDVSKFRNILNSNRGENDSDYIYEDSYEEPLMLGFEIFFDTNSPLFYDDTTTHKNSIKYFLEKYGNFNVNGDNISIDDIKNRHDQWKEFKNRIFSIFERTTTEGNKISTKPYYINKIVGLNKLNKKIITYGEDKLTITLNEDVRMISWYISELYNTLVYSYQNKRMMFPENLLRFNLNIRISDIRNFTMPFTETITKTDKIKESTKIQKNIKYKKSPKSTIMYTLHDCSFDFFNSYNFADDLTMAGYGASLPNRSELNFDIIYKSVTRWSNFPLLKNKFTITKQTKINPWNKKIDYELWQEREKIELDKSTNIPHKSYWNDRLTNIGQTVVNAGLNYLDNLETRLREERGNFVEKSLQNFREWTTINKIEPDNVYYPEFNNKLNLKNAGKALASDLLNDLEDEVRGITNF